MHRRRSPPTALRLVTGPIPPRSRPKHSLPSVPPPIFHPILASSSQPVPRPILERRTRITHAAFPSMENLHFLGSGSGNSSPVSAGSSRGGKVIRGPWDHSGSISMEFDVESVLAPPKPVAVSPGSGSWWVRKQMGRNVWKTLQLSILGSSFSTLLILVWTHRFHLSDMFDTMWIWN